MPKNKITFWEALRLYPPYLVRMRALKKGKATSDAEVAIASGIDINRVREIKMMTDWNNVTFGEIIAYTIACGFDPTSGKDRQRAQDYEAKCIKRKCVPYQYLRKSPKWESEFLPVIRLLQQKIRQSSAA